MSLEREDNWLCSMLLNQVIVYFWAYCLPWNEMIQVRFFAAPLPCHGMWKLKRETDGPCQTAIEREEKRNEDWESESFANAFSPGRINGMVLYWITLESGLSSARLHPYGSNMDYDKICKIRNTGIISKYKHPPRNTINVWIGQIGSFN